LIYEVDELSFEKHLIWETGFAGSFDGSVQRCGIGSIHQGFDELIWLRFFLFLSEERDGDREEDGKKSFHKYKKVGWF
jgi:hypothetical protein